MKEKTKKLILYIALCIITILILFLIIKINGNRLNNLEEKSFIGNYITEIKFNNIKDYLKENPDSIVYVSNSSEESSKNFEKKFKKVIVKYNLETELVYINIYNINNNNDIMYSNAPELLFYKDGIITDAISCDTLKTSDDIVNIFKERSVIGD